VPTLCSVLWNAQLSDYPQDIAIARVRPVCRDSRPLLCHVSVRVCTSDDHHYSTLSVSSAILLTQGGLLMLTLSQLSWSSHSLRCLEPQQEFLRIAWCRCALGEISSRFWGGTHPLQANIRSSNSPLKPWLCSKSSFCMFRATCPMI